MKVEMGKRYRTRDGRDVEIYGTDFADQGQMVVAGAILGEKRKIISRWDINGSYGCASQCDLIEVTEHVIPEGFAPWNGGKCPVDGNTAVEVILRDGYKIDREAGACWWNHNESSGDIIAYRVITPAIPEGFTAWSGGECPVDWACNVDVMLRNGDRINNHKAGFCKWMHCYPPQTDIIAWRHTPPKYRPFKNAEEFMPFSYQPFLRKGKSVYTRVQSFCDSWVEIEGDMLSWKEFFDRFEFHGGNPAGVRV